MLSERQLNANRRNAQFSTGPRTANGRAAVSMNALNDVIDSIRKSSNDDRLAPRDRQVLADDLTRLKDYQDHHNHWPR